MTFARLRVLLPLWLALAIAIPRPLVAQTQGSDPASLDQVASEVEAVLRKTNTPGAAVAIVRRGEPIWVRSMGVAEVASGRPVTSDTLFRIGSVSKIFAALAVLKLQEERRLDLQDTLRARAPDLDFANPWENEHPVRLVHLLEHTAGWDDWPVAEYASRLPTDGSLRDGLAFHPATRTSRWPPGRQFAYSNADAAAIAYVVERVTGMTFEAYVGQAWFAPLRMSTASYLGSAEVRSRLATSYQPDGKTPFPYWHQLERPAGAINASVTELAHLAQFFVDRGRFGGVPLLPVAALARMEAPASGAGARAGLRTGYGLANYTTIQDGFVYHGHDGSLLGYLTELKYLPDAGVGYVFSINSRNGVAAAAIGRLLRREVEKSLVPPARPAVATVPADVGRVFEGWYEDDGPRSEFMHWWWRLSSLSRASIGPTALTWQPLLRRRESFPATSERLFRRESDPVSTVALVEESGSGRQIQFSSRGEAGGTSGQAYRRVSFGIVLVEVFAVIATPCVIAATLVVAAIAGMRKLVRPARGGVFPPVMLAPTIASLIAVTGVMVVGKLAHGDLNQAIAIAAPSKPLFFGGAVALWVSAVTGIVMALWGRWEGSAALRWLALLTAGVLAASSGYLVYWGIVGFQTS